MAEIDELSIGIEASAKTAISTIDALNQKLNILVTSLGKINGSSITGLANGVNRLSTSMQGMKSVGTADFTRLAKNIEKLGSMNTAGLNTAASSLSHISKTLSGFESASAASAQIGDMAKNIAKLGNKSVQAAITNIPKLATAMKDLMQTLSTAPKVSQNLIDMTNALANFTQQGSKVSVVSGTLTSGLNRSSKAVNNAKKSSMSLAAAFGKFYATYFLVIRGVKKLWSSIKSSFDYLEILNYFDAAFGQVAANADLSAFEEMGYESADAYYGSFAKRAEEVTRKMSGFTIGENGLLQSTGAVSLGLDPSQLMNYQAMFGQMSSSMGVASETALKLSQALTEIGADLASVKNMKFEDVWQDMASGLAGMSRTLDKYGVNIRNVNLQQKLMELGIDANIQALNQNDKALLRAIILLENTKYAWGDLADTINQPANQLRLIQANFENLGRTIGNLFLPIVKTVLPYVNALVIAVQRLFAWLGNLIGIDISGISDAVGGADMGDILDQTDDLASGLGDAKKQADKLNKSLRQFDELKVINTKQDEGGAGTGAGIQGGLLDAAFEDAFTKYQQEWDKAFGKLENKAQEIADRIEKAFEPLKKIIQDFAIGDFFQAGKDTSALVAGIFNFFADAIDKVDWNGIGQKIGDFLAGIDWFAILKSVGNLIWRALKAAFELYVGAFSSAPLETALISLVAFPKLLKAITASKFITGIGKLWNNFKVWGEKISLVAGALTGNKAAASGLYMLYPKLGAKVDAVKTAFSNFFSSVKTNGFWKTVDGGITNIRNNLGGLQKAAIVAVAGFAEFSVVSDSVEKLTLGTENWLAEIGKIAGVVAAAGAAMYVALGPAGLAIAAITGVVAALKGVRDAQVEALEKFAEEQELRVFGDYLSNITTKLNEAAQATRDRMSASLEYVQNAGIGEMQMAKDLADRYFTLAEKEERTNEETEEMQRLAGLLIEKAPELNKYYDEQTGLINGTRDAINDVIEARLREIQLNAVSEKLTEAYRERVETFENLEKAANDVAGAQDEMKRLQEEYNEAVKSDTALSTWVQLTELRKTGITQLDDSARSQKLLNDAIKAGAEPTKDIIELQKQLAEIITQNGDKFPSTLGEITSRLGENVREIQPIIDTFSEKYKEAWNALEEQKAALESTESTIDKLSRMLSDGMTGVGEDFGTGYEAGILSKVSDVENAAREIADSGLFGLKDEQKSNSPSKMTMSLGEDFADGFNKGIENRIKDTEDTVRQYTRNTLEKFSEIIAPLNQIGIDAMQGLLNGLSSMESSIYAKADEIANNVANAVKSALEIHSPSRVMFRLGDFTMQGFKEGMENLYNPITDSIKAFSYDVAVAPAPNLTDMYSGYQYQPTYTPEYGISGYSQSGYNQGDPELKSLLRRNNELLAAILAKPNIEKGEIYNATKELYQRDSIRRYGNPSAYDPILGS